MYIYALSLVAMLDVNTIFKTIFMNLPAIYISFLSYKNLYSILLFINQCLKVTNMF